MNELLGFHVTKIADYTFLYIHRLTHYRQAGRQAGKQAGSSR